MSRTMRLGGRRPSCHRMVSYVFDGGHMRLSGHRANPDPNLDARLGCLPVSAPSAMPGNSHPIVQGAGSEGFWRSVNLNRSRRIALSAGANLDEEFRLRSNGWTGSSPYCSSKKSAGAKDIHGPVVVDSSSVLEEDHFHELADDVLHHLQDKIEVYGEDLNVDGFDLDHSSGVLTVRLGNLGTYVINKQTPNRQIWLSSPMSGPGRFDWSESKSSWIYRRNNVELVSLLEQELSELLGAPIHLSSG